MRVKLLAAMAMTAAMVTGAAAPAFAHVSTNPDSANRGAEITLGFRVPNEGTTANVTQFEIDLPAVHPIVGVAVQPVPGWTAKTTIAKLNVEVPTGDGPVTMAISQIIWTAAADAGTAPGQFQEFAILARLPKDADEVIFQALQSFSDGTIVRWIEPVSALQRSPQHPTPILELTVPQDVGRAAASPGSLTPHGTVDMSRVANKSSVDGARRVGVAGVVIGALGLIVAVVAIAIRPKAL